MTIYNTWAPRRSPNSAARTLNRAAAIVRSLTAPAPQPARLPQWILHRRVAPNLITPLPMRFVGVRRLTSGFPAAVYVLAGTGIEAWLVPDRADPRLPRVAHCAGGVRAGDFIIT